MLCSRIVVPLQSKCNTMLSNTYTYISDSGEHITINGFVASLLQQGKEWDIRQVEADIEDYHQLYYARMDAKEALLQEIYWWQDFANDARLAQMPKFQKLQIEGFSYLMWQAQEVVQPMSESEKLETNMAIYLDAQHYLYKVQDALALFHRETGADMQCLISGFPAQLLTYAACTTIDWMLSKTPVQDMNDWAEMMLRWLQYPSAIMLHDIQMDIPDVYILYATYVAGEKAAWDAANKKRYQSGQPQVRYFMTNLLKQLQAEVQHATELLCPYLTEKQRTAYVRYLQECQQYIADHTKTRSQPRRNTMDAYWGERATAYWKGEAAKLLKAAAQEKNPAAAIALEVKKLQEKKIIKRDILPYSRFVAAVNAITEVEIKPDTFSKHFRR